MNATATPLHHFAQSVRERLASGWQPSATPMDATDQALFAAFSIWKMSHGLQTPEPALQAPTNEGVERKVTDAEVLQVARQEEDRKRALQWVHGLAKGRDLEHEQLANLLCPGFGATSMAQLTGKQLRDVGVLLNAFTLDGLKQVWGQIHRKNELQTLKNYLKGWLTRKAEAKDAPPPPPQRVDDVPFEANTCKGKDCGQLIYWATTDKGKKVPLNPPTLRELQPPPDDPNNIGEFRYVEKEPGVVWMRQTFPASEGSETAVRAYMGHHIDCVNARHFKGKRRSS